MKVIQVLPELNSGGVERGAVEFADYLVANGHESIVISNGGRLVSQLEKQGSVHITFPVHKKSLFSLRFVKPLRKLLLDLKVDIIHVRSRLPAWLVWLAVGRLPRAQRPAIVSTFHGLYSINRYSEIMGRSDQVIAISQCVYDYVVENYSRISPEKISVIHRGVDQQVFNLSFCCREDWQEQFFSDYPQLKNKPLIVMPGRITQWKGHVDFLEVITILKDDGIDCHGVIVGGAENSKTSYLDQLKDKVATLELKNYVTFLGHRSDIQNIYSVARVVCNLSNRPEPFGRTVIEALALGVPVIAYDIGGPAESLRACFPEGLVPHKNNIKVAEAIRSCLNNKPEILLPEEFTLSYQAEKTLAVYQKALASS